MRYKIFVFLVTIYAVTFLNEANACTMSGGVTHCCIGGGHSCPIGTALQSSPSPCHAWERRCNLTGECLPGVHTRNHRVVNITGGRVSEHQECYHTGGPGRWRTFHVRIHNTAVCNPGYHRGGGGGAPGTTCVRCSATSFQPNSDFTGASCTACPAGQYANDARTACAAAPPPPPCPDGQYRVGATGACQDCPTLPAPNAAIVRNSALPRQAGTTNAARAHCFINTDRRMTTAGIGEWRFASNCNWVYQG